MTVLVTGASGFVGRALVPALAASGPVRALVRDRARAPAGVEVVVGDLLDPPSLDAAARGVEAVVHLAAVADSSDADLNHRVNVGGSRALAEACARAGVGFVLHVSSTCAARPKQDAYGRSKRAAEDVWGDLPVTHLRPAMIYGRGSVEFERFLRACRLPLVPIPGTGRSLLRPVALPDFVALAIRALDRRVPGRFDVAGPEPVPVSELVRLVGAAQGRRPRVLPVPGPLCLAGARVLGAVQAHPFANVDQVMAFLQDTIVDIEPTRRTFDWDPRPLEEGLAEVFGEEAA